MHSSIFTSPDSPRISSLPCCFCIRECNIMGGKKLLGFVFFLTRATSLAVQVGGVCCYHVICCLTYTQWSPRPALRLLSRAAHSTAGSIPSSRSSHLLDVGFVTSGPPLSFPSRKREITRPVTPFTFLPLQKQFCSSPQHRGRAREALPQHGLLTAGTPGTDIPP